LLPPCVLGLLAGRRVVLLLAHLSYLVHISRRITLFRLVV
jgi:hypothetical protein